MGELNKQRKARSGRPNGHSLDARTVRFPVDSGFQFHSVAPKPASGNLDNVACVSAQVLRVMNHRLAGVDARPLARRLISTEGRNRVRGFSQAWLTPLLQDMADHGPDGETAYQSVRKRICHTERVVDGKGLISNQASSYQVKYLCV